MFWKGVLDSDLMCNFWVDYDADWVAEGPGIDIENWREVVSCMEVVDHHVGSTIRGKRLHELANCGKVAEPEAKGWLWLGRISVLSVQGGQLTYQSIKSVSMMVEFEEKVYDGDSKKQ